MRSPQVLHVPRLRAQPSGPRRPEGIGAWFGDRPRFCCEIRGWWDGGWVGGFGGFCCRCVVWCDIGRLVSCPGMVRDAGRWGGVGDAGVCCCLGDGEVPLKDNA